MRFPVLNSVKVFLDDEDFYSGPSPTTVASALKHLRDLAAEAGEMERQLETVAKVIDVWAVNQGDDDRQFGKPTWFYDSAATAESVAARRGWFGGKAPVSRHKAILFGTHIYLLAQAEPIELNLGPQDQEELRQKALSKLTPTEKKLLGLH